MPVQVTYPGVYIEELPSSQHVISGVPTSITAFMGRAVFGKVNEPITIFNYGDYERFFGGLSYDYPMSYAVQDFFLNGGGEAIIVRLFEFRKDTWNEDAKIAFDAVKGAVAALRPAADAKPTEVSAAAAKAAAAFTEQPGKEVVQKIVSAANSAAKRTGAKAKDVQNAVKDLTFQAPPFPSSTAQLTLDTYTWASALKAVHSVVTAAVDSMFGADGNPIASAQLTPLTVYSATRSKVQQLTNSHDLFVSKIAKQINLKITKPDAKDTAKQYIDTIIDVVTTALQNDKHLPASVVSKTQVQSYRNELKILDARFDPQGGLKASTKKADVSTDLEHAKTSLLKPAKVPLNSQLTLEAANSGSWGGCLQAAVDRNGITPAVAENYSKYGLLASDLFNIHITYTHPTGQTTVESYTNVSIKDTKAPNRLDREINSQSLLVQVPLDPGSKKPQLPAHLPPVDAFGNSTGGDDSEPLTPLTYIGDENKKTGMYSLNKVEIFNLLSIPPDQRNTGDTDSSVYTEALKLCVDRRAMLIVDPPIDWADKAKKGEITEIEPTDPELGINGIDARNATVYFPRVKKKDLEMNEQVDVFPASGMIAGVIATTDVNYGVWKAPAGQNADLMGIQGLEVKISDGENGVLNPKGINCLRDFKIIGPVIWGARTLRGATELDDPYKYVPVRRLTLYVEQSLIQGTKWAIFEPNDETLWSSLRLAVQGFLAGLQRQGAFYNYKVVCDSSTTTPDDIANGIVNILVSIAPVKPAEFLVIKIQQAAAKI